MRRAWQSFLAIGLILFAGTARADDEEEARDAMRRGIAAFARGDTEAALAEYDAAKRLAPSANAPYRYAAEVLATLGRWKEVVANLEEYLAKNPSVSNAAEVRERIARVRADHFPARLTIVANVAGARASIDGQAEVEPGALEVPPGARRVEVTAPGKLPSTQDVTLVGDRDATLVFVLTDRPVGPLPATSVDGAPALREAPTMETWRTVGWIAAGAGVATIVTSFVIDTAVLGPKISDYRAAADRGDVSARGLHDDATSFRTGLVVSYVAGAVLGMSGAGLVLFGPRGRSTSVIPTATPHYAGVSGRVAF